MHKDINIFIRELNIYTKELSRHQIKTLRGQAVSGNVDGARKGLNKLLSLRRG